MKTYTYLILGGGTAAGYAAEEFAEQKISTGELLVIGAEPVLPMNRPLLSKDFLSGKSNDDEILIHDQQYYDQHGIEILTGTKVVDVNLTKKSLTLENNGQVGYGKLLIATGSKVRKLTIPGAEGHVYYLRTLRDAEDIKQKAKESGRVVVIGGQFIAAEVAASLRMLGLEVSLVYPEDFLMSSLATRELGMFFDYLFGSKGVSLLKNKKVTSLKQKADKEYVVLNTGEEIETDMIVAGIGVEPETGLFRNSGLTIDNGIPVNEYCETSIPGVYAAGDVARYPDAIFGKSRRVEHWQNAFEQGKLAAKNMAGHQLIYKEIPYFFSDLFDYSYDFYGDTAGAEDYVVKGKPNEQDFSIFWIRKDQIVAAFISAKRPDIERNKVKEWITAGHLINPEVLRQSDVVFENVDKP